MAGFPAGGGEINFRNLPTGTGGINTSFGYGPAIPGGQIFNQVLGGMVGELGQDVSADTETPMADKLAAQFAGDTSAAAKALSARGFTGGMPAFEDALSGNYLQALMGIPPAGAAAQQQFRQNQLTNLARFPQDVAGNLASEQSAHLRYRGVQDAQQQAFNDAIGGLISGGIKLLMPQGLGSVLGSSVGNLIGGATRAALPGNVGEIDPNTGFPIAFQGNQQYPAPGTMGVPPMVMPTGPAGGPGGGMSPNDPSLMSGVPDWLQPWLEGATFAG